MTILVHSEPGAVSVTQKVWRTRHKTMLSGSNFTEFQSLFWLAPGRAPLHAQLIRSYSVAHNAGKVRALAPKIFVMETS